MDNQRVSQTTWDPVRDNHSIAVVESRRPFARYERALGFLLGRTDYERNVPVRYDPNTYGLMRIQALLTQVGNPHEKLRTVHIAGSKGKGSTATMLARMLEASGYQVGLYTSPHLEDLRERISINGKLIGKAQLVDLLNRVYTPLQQLTGRDSPTFFDIMTTLAFMHFLDNRVDLAVIETGLGGRLDSTNVIIPEVVGITSLSLDHMHQLGPTIEHIAREKAGIFKHGVPIVTSDQNPSALNILQAQALALKAPFAVVGRDMHYSYRHKRSREKGSYGKICLTTETHSFEHQRVPLHGEHQAQNCALALALLDRLQRQGYAINKEEALRGIDSMTLPGRMEMISSKPRILIDGAHNVASIRALIQAIALHISADSVTMIFGCNLDKDIEGMLQEIQYGADKIVFTASDSPRAVSPQSLAERYTDICGKMCQAATNLEQAMEMIHPVVGNEDLICITGSFYLIGTARKLFLR
ncbi:bifunctional folylpolyglutamate synthase/dihydrofolate synthase [Planctomycetota bacterium]